MKILITGVHGFVGSNLVKKLSVSNTIYGLDIVSPQKDGVKYTFSWDYLEQSDGIPEVDAIVHLAGKAHDTKNQSAADVYFLVNTELTKRIYDYYLKSKAKKFIFFSSVKAVADRVEGNIIDENVIPCPKGPYGESKIAAEEYIRKLEDERKKNGQHTYILRPCMIHGPGNKGNLNLLYGVVKKGIPWPLAAYENKRSFASIGNVAYVVERLLDSDVDSGIYNVCDDEPVSTNKLIGIICQSMGRKAYMWKIPKGLIRGIAKLGDILHLPLNSERFDKLTENYIVDNSKIKHALGIESMPISARDGFRRTIQSMISGKGND